MKQNLKDISEIAEKFKVKRSWLYSRTRTNDIPHYKLGKYVRFVESEVWQWLKNMQSGEE